MKTQQAGNSVTDARWIVTLLAVLGVSHFVYCPGSRSAPFAYALADLEETLPTVSVHPKIDERSAAFFALGIAKAADEPVAVIMTSGTAVAHTLPAVMEAHHTNTPLLIISADRPFEMRGVGASQTTQQVGIFSHFVRTTVDLPAGLGLPVASNSVAEGAPANVKQVFNQLRHLAGCWQATSVQRGPAHLNVAFRDPLVPVETGEDAGLAASAKKLAGTLRSIGTWFAHANCGPWPAPAGAPASVVDPQLRTVIVVGEHRYAASWSWEEMVENGYVILAEPGTKAFSLGLSAPSQQQQVTAYGAEIEQIVVIGRPTLSRPLTSLINRPGPRIIVVAEGKDYPDLTGAAAIVTDQQVELPQLAEPARQWAQTWYQRATDYVRSLGKPEIEGSPALSDGLKASQIVWDTLGANPLVVGASNAIRYLDLVADTTSKHGQIYTNRGQAGIDGTIAFARGVHRYTHGCKHSQTVSGSDLEPVQKQDTQMGERTVALLGDITFLHDASSLLSRLGEATPAIDLVVLDDAGGRIFTSLEHGAAASPDLYERYFAMGQSVDYQALAAAYGWAYVQVAGLQTVESQSYLQQLLSETDVVGGRVLHIRCDHAEIATQIRSLF